MVATRRAARRGPEPAAPAAAEVGGNRKPRARAWLVCALRGPGACAAQGSAQRVGPPARGEAAERLPSPCSVGPALPKEVAARPRLASAEVSTPVSAKMSRRRTKGNSQPEIIHESQDEGLEDAETKSDLGDPSEAQTTKNRDKNVHSAKSCVEPQADGDEAESNYSAVSELETPLFIRITRRRQITIPYQPDSPAKNRPSKAALLSELSKSQDEDVSEAESCSSAVSGVCTTSATRTTRSRKCKAKLHPDPVCEAQAEEVSDAESWCSGLCVEPTVTTKRITRSMLMKAQAETIRQTEKKVSEVVLEDETLTEDRIKSQPVDISDCERVTKSDSDTEQASSLSSNRYVTQSNKQPSPCKTQCQTESANTNPSDDPKQVLIDSTPSSPKETGKRCTIESPKKEAIKETHFEIVDNSEEMLEKERHITGKESQLKSASLFLSDHESLDESFKSQRQTTPSKSKIISEHQKADIGEATQRSLTHGDELMVADKPTSTTSTPQKGTYLSPVGGDSDGDCKMSINVDNGVSQAELVTKSSSHVTKRSCNKKESAALLLSSDESDEMENSDVEEVSDVGENLYCTETRNQTSSLNKSLEKDSSHGELFVIDTEPGLDGNKKYYLEQEDRRSDAESKDEDRRSDAESKDEESERDESSDLEDNEEEFVDEDEHAYLLKKKKPNILHLSSSIDPGLNIKSLGGLYISFDAGKQKAGSSAIKQLKGEKKEELLQKSIITPDFEKKDCVPPFRESTHQIKKQRKAEREKTTGDGWFGMKAPEMTNELKNDLKALKMRASMDPKHFYKKNDRDGLPKYFQVGTVVDTPIDFYHARIPKKQRKRTIVEELLADSEFRRYNKRKYQEIMTEKAALAAGKKNRKKKKFHK
ncbi:deoxynucleotidyltransferase terminal-interacting protein 2 isoform X2 [Chelonia mydas]|uniref:deoxynucleotidyltransferase terminal-interacting protein 2 isoform X2 n=1 Tax=Chelonia mydas TaxID=8469 RepID=UPI001CA84652|nr:deoxynucleotidyltransferase terminal-interacting protein 2 isoform X2 [Chelonia mydas]